MHMPRLDSLKTTQKIRALSGCERIQILAMTANALTENRIRVMQAGMNNFIAKPVNWDTPFSVLLGWLKPR